MGNLGTAIIAATVTLVIAYLFLADGDQSSKVIRSLAASYGNVVIALQGKGQYNTNL